MSGSHDVFNRSTPSAGANPVANNRPLRQALQRQHRGFDLDARIQRATHEPH